MTSKTTNLELNIKYKSPSTHLNLKDGYDENYNILDEQYQYILGTLENTDLKFEESIDLTDSFAYEWEDCT